MNKTYTEQIAELYRLIAKIGKKYDEMKQKLDKTVGQLNKDINKLKGGDEV